MDRRLDNDFSRPVTVFHGRPLPEPAIPVGYAALVDAWRLPVPLPRRLAAIGPRHIKAVTGAWAFYTPRHRPPPTLEGHLTFALKYEGLDLAVLERLFDNVPANDIESLVRSRPTGRYMRRLWFLYEWLTGRRLDLPDADRGGYVDAVDPAQQWAIDGTRSPRHRVRNNLPGTPAFCPLVFRTESLDSFVASGLAERARALADAVPRERLRRAAAYLLLQDSRASYVIEGERPAQDRIQRWGRAIGEAGRTPLTLDELVRLQSIVIGDQRFVRPGLRQDGGFVGTHDRDTQAPIPAHIGARPEDLVSLIDGMTTFDRDIAGRLEPVVAAAALALGFVYVHPFEDGNGRIHRYLVHHVLARRGFNPPGLSLPVSTAILDRIDAYREALESYSRRLLPVIAWEPTPRHNVRVLNDTADFYRYFDATPHAEFLYGCLRQVIEQDLPNETQFLARRDAFRAAVADIVDLPDRVLDTLLGFLRQSEGRLSKRAREREFAALTDDEASRIEAAYAETFRPGEPAADT